MKPKAIIVTPVKNSLETVKKTFEAISNSEGSFNYIVYNDFSDDETKKFLNQNISKYDYEIIHLEEITTNPSPNYKLVLQDAQKRAIALSVPLIIIESDVIIKNDTIVSLLDFNEKLDDVGMIAAITTDKNGDYNFPYNFVKKKSNEVIATSHRLSFCCTLLSYQFLKSYQFNHLDDSKDWYDVFISRQSIKNGYKNYIAKGTRVLHLPHSSRPWKHLKYKNPLLYYFKKYFFKRDKI